MNTEAQLARYQHLIAISRDLASTLDLDILLGRIVDAAADLTAAEAASILLHDSRSGKLHFQVATNFDPRMRGFEVPVEKSIAGWIINTGQPARIANAQSDERLFAQIGQAVGSPTQTLLGVPLKAHDKIIGVLEAINKRQGEFTPEDQEILVTLGAHAAIAIENSRLFQQFDLIAEFVHELRTPLAALQTAAHLLNHPDVNKAKRQQLSTSIQTEIARLTELSTNFLNLAQLESGRSQLSLETFDLKALLEECAALIRPDAECQSLKCKVSLPDTTVSIKGDCDKIKQAVFNLLNNAVKYNRPGGSVSLKLEVEPDVVCITVTDTGIGIPPKYINQLTNKFFRVPGAEKHAQGTGLGLSIVKRIVEAHGGHLEMKSEEGSGSRFTIHLPR